MNTLNPNKQKAIIQGYNLNLSIRGIADIVQCSPITVGTYLKLGGIKTRSISEGMVEYHKLKKVKLPKGILEAIINSIEPENIVERKVFCACCGFNSTLLELRRRCPKCGLSFLELN